MVRTLELNLGTLGNPTVYATGWYQDPAGQQYYYDALIKQWYVYSAGLLFALSFVPEPAPKVVAVSPGDTLRITIKYKYSGPARTVTERAAVGIYGTFGFDEKVYKQQTYAWPEAVTPTLRTTSFDIVIPDNVASNWDDIYAKVSLPEIEAFFGYENALSIVAIIPEFTEFTIDDYVKV